MATLYYRPATADLICDPTQLPEKDHQPRRLREQPNEEELPSQNAIENLLPKFQYILKNDDGPQKLHPRNLDDMTDTVKAEDVERVSMSLLDYQQQELEKYREAVKQLGQSIVELKDEVRRLKVQNSSLRRDLDNYHESVRHQLNESELGALPAADIAKRYVILRHTMELQADELMDYKDKLLKAQNELIKKNDREKDLENLSAYNEERKAALQQLNDRSIRVRQLEGVIRQQEEVIEKMEKTIKFGTQVKVTQKDIDEAEKALMEENKRLREELDLAKMRGNASLWPQERAEMMLTPREHELRAPYEPSQPALHNSTSRVPPNQDVSKQRVHMREMPVNPLTRITRYSHERPERKKKPHMSYNHPDYNPTIHS